jgi:RNA polymerase sigma factor (sigma-70 family)
MSNLSREFAVWLSRNILPYEPAVRKWLESRNRLDRLGLTADDIVQECYARLAKLESVDHIRKSREYFFRTAHSIVLQEVRRSRVVSIDAIESIDAQDVTCQLPTPDHLMEIRQEMSLLSSAISSMPKKCQAVFVLRKIEGYSQREIAEKLGISENTVESHLAKGIKKLMEFYRASGKLGGALTFSSKFDEAGNEENLRQRKN